jgi:DNA-directed RNA polymerase specialized sigma24 family protein
MPLTTNAILDRTDSVTGTDRLAALFDSHQKRLFHLALRLCSDREEARDLVQEAFLRAARQPGSPVRDVARLLGVTEVTVRWHLLAARRELAKVLGEKP